MADNKSDNATLRCLIERWQTSFPPHHPELEEETSTREFSEGATSVLLGNHQPLYPLYFCTVFACPLRHIRVRASRRLQLNCTGQLATLVLRGHIIVGVASKSRLRNESLVHKTFWHSYRWNGEWERFHILHRDGTKHEEQTFRADF